MTLIILAASGCSAEQAASPAAPAPPPAAVATPTPSPAQVATLQLPIADYMLTPRQSAELKWLNAEKVAVCMKQYGFDLPVAPSPVVSPSDSLMFRRYGVTDPASVSTWGYHLPRGDNAAPKATLSPAENAVLLGRDAAGKPMTSSNGQSVPTGGCQGKVNTELASLQPGGPGSSGGTSQLVAQTKGESFAHSMADPRVQEVFGHWSECMRGKGFSTPNPLDAGADLPSVKEPKPDATEIRMAQADVDCKARTNLLGIWFAVEADYQKAAIARQPQAFAALKAERDAQAARIEQLVAGLAGR
ncbi:hypothetical protein LN042_31080 [Kitasatospora sp. RB6PN24]|uniref:hypothetical protein n=1 Tax=Kitasatospora humi TaxID=2893891 RepID=UPI001E316C9D|nr:hypothetical protein [Kitasatospora humi]MCC9311456.1 hypothetical protein [Kitasatospora humi]